MQQYANIYLLQSYSMFWVLQHPSSEVLKTVTAASGTDHNTGAATSLQRGFAVNKYLHAVASSWIFIHIKIIRSTVYIKIYFYFFSLYWLRMFEHNEDVLFKILRTIYFMFLINLNCPNHFQDQYPYSSVESTGCRGNSDFSCKSHVFRKSVREVILSDEK